MLPRSARHFPSLLFTVLLWTSSMAYAQFQVGSTSLTFVDPSRGNRNISVLIKYPAETAGVDVAPAVGEYPVLAWAHGLTVSVDSYGPIWDALVPAGYVVALPRTEGTFGANPLALGRDLAFVIGSLHLESQNGTSLFFGAIDTTASAIGGHSMGGGAATLAAAENPWITTLVSAAAIDTNPSAVTAAANISMPTLMFGGTADCVIPIATHQRPIHLALAADCKYLVSLTNGTHCGFLDAGSACENFEGGCPTSGVQRQQQVTQVASLLVPWLEAHVKGDASALETVKNVLATDSALTSEGDCLPVPVESIGIGKIKSLFR